MPRILYTYPHISHGMSATFNTKDPKNDYPTTDEIIRQAKNVGPSSVGTFSDLHWSDFTYVLVISADADVR